MTSMKIMKSAILFFLVACTIIAQATNSTSSGGNSTSSDATSTTSSDGNSTTSAGGNSTTSSDGNSTTSSYGNSTTSSGGKNTFNVNDYGASGDGKTDSTSGFSKAWTDACAAAGSTFLVGSGKYVLGPITFTGPCKGPITFQLDGTLLATTDLGSYKENWIEFEHVDGLTVTGSGTADGQGAATWPSNKCRSGGPCKCFPMSLVFAFTDNLVITGIHSLNPKYFHFNIFSSKNVLVSGVTITAPENSPNTDGIHMGDVSNITIKGATIGTGDDCISIGAGAQDVTITNVTCGPGHGISLGSFGKYNNEKDVSGITVQGCTLSKTTNGLRIKTFQNNPSPLKASDIHFEDITMNDVANPIIVDQEYCPNGACSAGGVSTVAISQVTFKNIKGTSSTPETVTLKCSKSIPCEGISLSQIQVAPTSGNANVTCTNAKGTADGTLNHPCFK